jgi:hypothetical protein
MKAHPTATIQLNPPTVCRLCSAALVLAAIAVGGHAVPARAQQYSVTDLGQFDPVAMNSSAQIIGYATTEDSQGGTPSGTPEVYTTGSGITDLSSLIGSGGLVEGINDAGLIVGALDQTNGGAFAYWPNVGLFDLTNDVGTLTTGSGINNNDLIVGAYPNFGGAFIYQLGALSPETVLNPGAL